MVVLDSLVWCQTLTHPFNSCISKWSRFTCLLYCSKSWTLFQRPIGIPEKYHWLIDLLIVFLASNTQKSRAPFCLSMACCTKGGYESSATSKPSITIATFKMQSERICAKKLLIMPTYCIFFLGFGFTWKLWASFYAMDLFEKFT